MDKLSMADVAFELLSAKKKDVLFQKLWNEICEIKGFDEAEAQAKISLFYTNLTLDGRFITTGENKWDLRARHTFDAVHIDMNDIYADEEGEGEDEDDSSIEDSYEDE